MILAFRKEACDEIDRVGSERELPWILFRPLARMDAWLKIDIQWGSEQFLLVDGVDYQAVHSITLGQYTRANPPF